MGDSSGPTGMGTERQEGDKECTMKNAGTQAIETDRLYLRRLTVDDAPAMYNNWASDPEVTRYLTWKPHADVEETRGILAAWAGQYGKADFYMWGIVLRQTGELIGNISVVDIQQARRCVELGYCEGRAFWGRGYMTEALRAVCAYLFTHTDVERIAACHHVENPASGRVMKKAGLLFEGIARLAGIDGDGQLCDLARYAIIRSDLPPEGVDELSDGEITLRLDSAVRAVPGPGGVASCYFTILRSADETEVGVCDLRLGHNANTAYSGNAGYEIYPQYRGNRYAAKACRLLFKIAKANGMEHMLLTCRQDDAAAYRTCELTGAAYIGTEAVPEWHNMHAFGIRQVCRFDKRLD